MNNRLKAIIFDLDDTLVKEEPAAITAFMYVCRRVEQQFGIKAEKLYSTVRETARDIWRQSPARRYCVEIGISSWEGLWAKFEGDDPNLKILREWSPTYRLNTWNTTLIKCGINDSVFASELADSFFLDRRKYLILYDDAINCLEDLYGRIPLALVTNGVPDLQREKIETTGIAKYFKEIVVSGEVGYGKPDQRIYELVLSRLEVLPESVFNIGDSLERDVLGAKAVGIKTIWLNRHGIQRDESIVPDFEISNLGQLMDIIK